MMTPLRTLLVGITAATLTSAATAQESARYDEITTAGKVALQAQLTPPASYYEFDGTTLAWREPRDADTHYLRLLVRDAGQQAFIHGCTVQAAFQQTGNKAIGTTFTLHETWDSSQTHYGCNIDLPKDITTLTLVVTVQPPKGRRMSRHTGDFLTRPATVVFPSIDVPKPPTEIKTDDKASTPATTKIEWPEGRRPYVEPTPYPGSGK